VRRNKSAFFPLSNYASSTFDAAHNTFKLACAMSNNAIVCANFVCADTTPGIQKPLRRVFHVAAAFDVENKGES
jgi:hypothetical protein